MSLTIPKTQPTPRVQAQLNSIDGGDDMNSIDNRASVQDTRYLPTPTKKKKEGGFWSTVAKIGLGIIAALALYKTLGHAYLRHRSEYFWEKNNKNHMAAYERDKKFIEEEANITEGWGKKVLAVIDSHYKGTKIDSEGNQSDKGSWAGPLGKQFMMGLIKLISPFRLGDLEREQKLNAKVGGPKQIPIE